MKTKKILIVSIYDNNNYGNKLQNYALQEVLEKFGFNVETSITTKNNTYYSVKDNFKISYRRSIENIMKNIILKLNNKIYDKYALKKYDDVDINRINNIKMFDKLIIKSPIKPEKRNYKKINKEYDYIILGSDQIWNPYFIYNYSLFFGKYFDIEKKIAYAASIGIDKLSKKHADVYRELIGNFYPENISVREYKAYEIIKNLNEYNVKVVLDPTMLINRCEWLKISKKPKYLPNKRYILTYILGDMNIKRKKVINEMSKDYNLEVINLMNKSIAEIYTSGVEQFLWYISNASLVITDSFHAGVFSIIFNKDFYIIDRQGNSSYSMNSRFNTLLSTFEIEDRFLYNISEIELTKKIDYDKVNKILERERIKSLNFLEKRVLSN